MTEKLSKLTPRVPRKVLFLLASLFWLVVSLKLLSKACDFFMEIRMPYWFILYAVLGVIPFYYFVFRKITDKYISRIWRLTNDKPCMFAFFSWKSYVLVLFMIGLGIGVSMMPVIPAKGLHAFLITLGITMFLSAIRFVKAFFDYVGETHQ